MRIRTEGQQAERWLVRLRRKGGSPITLGVGGGKDFAAVRAIFEAKAVPTVEVAVGRPDG